MPGDWPRFFGGATRIFCGATASQVSRLQRPQALEKPSHQLRTGFKARNRERDRVPMCEEQKRAHKEKKEKRKKGRQAHAEAGLVDVLQHTGKDFNNSKTLSTSG